MIVTDENNKTYVIETIKGFEDEYEEGYEFVIKVQSSKQESRRTGTRSTGILLLSTGNIK